MYACDSFLEQTAAELLRFKYLT